MYKKWSDTPICWLCDYWWTILLALLVVVSAILSRGYWMPALGLENTPIASATPENPSTTQFVDPMGEYSFSPIANWPVEDVGTQFQQWALPDGVVMSVHSEPASPSDTLESWAQEVVTRLPYDVISQSQVQVAGQPAIRQEVAYPGQSQRIAVGYLVLYNGQKYQIALAGLQGLSESDQERAIQEFEQVLTTFQFQQ